MSNLPNTTQVPNKLLNGEMAKMKDTELRVVLIVTRKTLGWIADPETGMRKEEDWISHRQLLQLTNRASRAVSAAIDSGVKRGWIEARDGNGELLDTKEKRKYIGRGGRIYYRLGRIFLDRAKRFSKGKTKDEKVSKKERDKRKEIKGKTTKGNLITKQTVLQNYSLQSLKLAKLLYQLIKEENPHWHVQPNWDKWAEDMDKIVRIDKRTYEQVEWMVRWTQADSFWRQNILSPNKLRAKFNDLVIKAKNQNNQNKGKQIIW